MCGRRRLAALALGLVLAGGIVFAGEPSIAELQDLTQRHPSAVPAWDRLGQALAREGRFAEAQQAFAAGLRLAPDDKTLHYHLALSYAWSGDYARALSRYEELLKRYPKDDAIRLDYGQTLAWARRFDAARAEYERVLAREPQHVEALRHLGLLTAWEGRYPQALGLLRQARQRAPRNVHVLVNIGEVLSWSGDLAEAATVYREVLVLEPQHVEALMRLAQIDGWQGRIRQAEEGYRRAIAAAPRNLEARLGLAEMLMGNHQYARAEEVLRQARILFPADQRLSEKLASLAAQREVGIKDVIAYAEPVLFVFILWIVFRHAWRYRRVLAPHRPLVHWLIRVLPGLAFAMLAVFVFALVTGQHYRQLEIAHETLELLSLVALLAVFFALFWLLRFARPAREQTVLAIGAHPDDIEFGCGAALLRLREEGARVHGIVLSGGERGAGETKAGARRDEAEAAGRRMALTSLHILGFPDTDLAAHQAAIKDAIETAVAQHAPDIVFTHTAHDLHSDHKTVFEATREAVRGPCTLLCYENPNTPPGFQPSYFIDISDYLEDKIAALAKHKTQAGKPYLAPEVVRAAAGFRGTQARVRYAEAFEAIRVLDKSLAP